MLPIFSNTYRSAGRISQAPQSAWFQGRIQENVQRLKAQFQSNVRGVHSNHPLVQALKHSGSYTNAPVDLFNAAYTRYPYISKNLKFTTDYNRGSFKGSKVLSSKDSMIYASSEYISPYEAVNTWRKLSPLTCLWLDKNYMDMSIPQQPDTVFAKGFSSIAVDIPMMSLMYKGFKATAQANNSEAVYGEEEFVGTWVLPTLVESQVDMTCISALIAVFEGKYERIKRVESNYYFQSYSDDFRKIADFVLGKITDTRMSYTQILQNIPVVYKDSAHDALTLPDFAPTTQVTWAMLATRLRVINFLLDVGGVTGRRANQGFINQLKALTRDVRNSRIPYDVMSDEMRGFMENSLTRYGKL